MSDEQEKIKELEEQIHFLTKQLEELIQEKEDRERKLTSGLKKNSSSSTNPSDEESKPPSSTVVSRLSERWHYALVQMKQKPWEQIIGLVWASRIAGVLLMTAVVLTIRSTMYATFLGPTEKLLLGYILSACLILLDVLSKRKNVVTEVALGCGLAGIYFTTYAGLFIKETQWFVIGEPVWYSLMFGIPILLVCLIPIVVVAHQRNSITIAGISLFLTYYTVALSCYNELNIATLIHALTTSVSIAFITFLFHCVHEWFFLSWTGVIASYLTYIYVFLYLNPQTYFHIPDRSYFWISFSFLTVCFVLCATTCMIEAKRRGEYRKGVAPLVGLNSFIYFALTFYAVRQYYLSYEFAFRIFYTILLAGFTFLSHRLGPRNNYVFQIFIVKTIIMATLAIQAYFSGELLLIAMSIECLALALAHKRSGYSIYKWLNILLLFATFIWGLVHLRLTGETHIFKLVLPRNWFILSGTALFLFITAWLYEHFIRTTIHNTNNLTHTGTSHQGGHYEISSFVMSILHSGIASLLILFLTLHDFVNQPQLPFLLMFEFLLLASLGYIVTTSSLEFSGVLFIGASQISYLLLFFTSPQSLIHQPHFIPLSTTLACVTVFGAWVWERYLNSTKPMDNDLLHFILTILPYMSSVLIMLIVVQLLVPGSVVPVIVAGFGLILFGVGYGLTLPSWVIVGWSLILLGTVYICAIPVQVSSYSQEKLSFWIALGVCAIDIIAERIMAYSRSNLFPNRRIYVLLRVSLIGLLIFTGMLDSRRHIPQEILNFYWLGFGAVIVLLGFVLRESLYRWAGFLVLFITLLRMFFIFQYLSSEVYQILMFMLSAFILFLIGWIYSKNEIAQ